MMTKRTKCARKWWSLSGGATTTVLTGLILIVSACSDSSSTATQVAGTGIGSSTTTVTTAETGVETSIADPEPARLLTDAIAEVGTRYEFDTSVDLTGGTLTLVSGRLYDDASTYLITTAGSELEYVITPEGRWVRDAGGDWVALQESPPFVHPLSMLAAPTAIEVLDADNTTVTMAATYVGETLGFPDTDVITLELVITGSRLTSIRYSAAVSQDVATVETEISTTLDVEPVTAPAGAG